MLKRLIALTFFRAEGNSKETWRIINEIRGKHEVKIKPSFITDGNVVEERRAIANRINNTLHQLSLNSKNVIIVLLLNPFQTKLIMSTTKTLLNLLYRSKPY